MLLIEKKEGFDVTLLITTYPKKLNVEKMQELFMVSRNSILNDILEIKKM